MEINNFIGSIYQQQLQIEKNIQKIYYFNRLLEKSKIAIPYTNISYSDKIKVIVDKLDIVNVDTVKKYFVDYDIVDNVIAIKYQNLSDIKSYINQVINMEDVNYESYLVTNSYINSFLLKKENSYLYSSSVGELTNIDEQQKNIVIGFNDLKKYFIESNDKIDFDSYNKIGKINFFVTKNEINSKYSIESNLVSVSNIEVEFPYFYFNKNKINETFVTQNNLYLNDNCILNDDKQMCNVFYIKKRFIKEKASKRWIVPYLKKKDSNKTEVVQEITDAIISNTEITKKKETITNEEALIILNNITQTIKNSMGEC